MRIQPNRRWAPLGAAIVLLAFAVPSALSAQLTAVDDSLSVAFGTTTTIAAPGVLANEAVAGRTPPVTAVLDTAPLHHVGAFTLNPDGSFTYDHDGSLDATDSFTYHVTDGTSISNVATVTLSITGGPGGPEAGPDSYTVVSGGTLTIPAPGVLGNDTPAQGGALTATLVTPPGAGTLTLNADGSFTYVHGGGTEPSDNFTYEAVEAGVSSPPATVTISITSATGPQPVALTVRMPDVAVATVEAEIGSGTVGDYLSIGAAATQPATVEGLTGVTQTAELRLRTADPTNSATTLEELRACEKLALVAQARPTRYDLTIVLSLPDAIQIGSADAELILVDLPAGSLRCTLTRP